ncbi:MAG: MFS transporter [Dehalococcoidales bacterium]|nr:MFS transporter [Dehalococcoidales bacterium]
MTGERDLREYLKGTPNKGLFSATLGFFIGFAAVALFGPTAKQFQDVMSLSPVMLGFLVAIPTLSGSLLRIPFGAWADTSGGRRPFLILLILAFAGMATLFEVVTWLYPDRITAAHYPLLLLLGVLCGCGIATFSVGIGQVSYWFPQRKQGTALGLYGGIGNIAPGLFSMMLPLALGGWGLQGAYLVWLILLGAGIIIYFITGQDAYYFQCIRIGQSPAKAKDLANKAGQEFCPYGNAMQSLGLAARNWKTWVLVSIYFTSFGGFIALTAWLPTYWGSFFGLRIAIAGILTAAFSLLASIIRVGGGSLSDRLGGERTAVLSLSTLLVGSIIMTFSHSFGISVAGEIIMAGGMGVANAAVFKLVPQEVREAVGGAAGWVGGIGAFGGFVIPPLMGFFVSLQGNDGYANGFAIFIALSVISIVLAYVLQRVSVVGKLRVPSPAVTTPEKQRG